MSCADGGHKLNEPLAQRTQFRIHHLLVATAVLATVFALARVLGLAGTLTVFAFSYVVGPTIAFMVALSGKTRKTRYGIAATVLVVMLSVGYSVAAILDPRTSAIVVILGTVCAWGPQIAFLCAIYTAWKSGLRSAGVEPRANPGPGATATDRMHRRTGGQVETNGS